LSGTSFGKTAGYFMIHIKQVRRLLRRYPGHPILSLGAICLTCLASLAETNIDKSSASPTRLNRQHLQAIHDERPNLRSQHKLPAPAHDLYTDFRAVFVPMREDPDKKTRQQILAAARKTGIHILILTSPRSKLVTWRGLQDGILVIPGIETDEGTLLFQNANSDDKPISGSGVKFLRYVERSLTRRVEGLAGIEIYNSRTASKLEDESEALAAPGRNRLTRQKLLANLQAFPDEFFAGPSTYYPNEIFAKWDKDSEEKVLTGIGVNETPFISLFKEAGIDPFEISFRNVVTHILAQDLNESSIRDALTNGHVYVAHDWLCSPTGFSFGAINNLGVFGTGDNPPMLGTTRLVAMVPVPAKLRLVHKGALVHETSGTNLTFQAKEPGPYRLEAWVSLAGEEKPWIYSNPVYLKTPASSDTERPPSTISKEVKVSKNLVYREGSEEDSGKHKLDIYSPNGETNCPVLFFIHGGAWRSGDRSLYGALGNRYARAGFVTVVPSYRLAPKHPHPAQIEDVAAAFAWTIQHISEYRGISNRVYVAGHSAGGHLASLLALDDSHLAAHGLSPKRIRGVLALSGVYNLTIGESQQSVFGKDPVFRRKASPLFHIKTGSPPFLVTFCEWDYFSLPAQARQFHRALESAGITSELVFIPRQNHISEIVNVWRKDDPMVLAALKFMK
jgi:acetyl esterase/lipase